MRRPAAFCLSLAFLSLACSSFQIPISNLQRTETASPTLVPSATITPTRTPSFTRTPTITQTATPAEPPAKIARLSWHKIAQGKIFDPVDINALAADPEDPSTIYAGTYGAGMYISRDGGKSWEQSNAGLGKGTVGSIAVDPDDTDVVYAGLFDQGGVYKSIDGGRTWTDANRGIDLSSSWNWTGLVYLDPTDSRRLYFTGTSNGLYVSEDSAATWTRVHESIWITDMVIDPSDGKHLFAGTTSTGDGVYPAYVYESADGGMSWKKLALPTPDEPIEHSLWHIAADPNDFRILYAGDQESLYRTTDGGVTWTEHLKEGCALMAVRPNGNLYCRRDLNWESTAVFLHPDGRTMYVGAESDVWRSADGGQTWSRLSALGAAGGFRMVADPRDGDRLFLTVMRGYSRDYRSIDGGISWQPSLSGFSAGWLTIDPIQNILYRPSPWDHLYRSYDNGVTWKKTDYHEPLDQIWQVVPDPSDSNRLWAVEECEGPLLLSIDNGNTFEPVKGFPQNLCQPYLMTDGFGQRVYVVHWGGFLFSKDGGKVWGSSEGVNGIFRSAALDPSDPDTVYLGSNYSGILKTVNGGGTWKRVNNNMNGRCVNAIAVHPRNSQIVYAATDDGLYVSHNGGEWWWKIENGYEGNPVVYSVAVDPGAPANVFAFTPEGVFKILG